MLFNVYFQTGIAVMPVSDNGKIIGRTELMLYFGFDSGTEETV